MYPVDAWPLKGVALKKFSDKVSSQRSDLGWNDMVLVPLYSTVSLWVCVSKGGFPDSAGYKNTSK